jgi:hypothetical protein
VSCDQIPRWAWCLHLFCRLTHGFGQITKENYHGAECGRRNVQPDRYLSVKSLNTLQARGALADSGASLDS